jgi:hypothetical protein
VSKSRSQLSSSIHPTKLSRVPPTEAAHRHQLPDSAEPSVACSPSHSGSASTPVRPARNCRKQSASVGALHCAAVCPTTTSTPATRARQPHPGGGANLRNPITSHSTSVACAERPSARRQRRLRASVDRFLEFPNRKCPIPIGNSWPALPGRRCVCVGAISASTGSTGGAWCIDSARRHGSGSEFSPQQS